MNDRRDLATRVAAEFHVFETEAADLVRIAQRHTSALTRAVPHALAFLTFFVAAAFISSAVTLAYSIARNLAPSLPPPPDLRLVIIALSVLASFWIALAVLKRVEFTILADALRQAACLRRCVHCAYDFTGLDTSTPEFRCPECGKPPLRLPANSPNPSA